MNAPHERFVNQSNALVLEPTPFDGNAGSSTESARSESSNRSNESKPAAAPLRIMT
jgi:hypothetical protein